MVIVVIRGRREIYIVIFVITGIKDMQRVPLVEKELLTLPEHLSSLPVFSGVSFTRSLVLCVCFVDRCLSFFFWPFCCLFFFDIRILIVPLVSSNSSYGHICNHRAVRHRYDNFSRLRTERHRHDNFCHCRTERHDHFCHCLHRANMHRFDHLIHDREERHRYIVKLVPCHEVFIPTMNIMMREPIWHCLWEKGQDSSERARSN